MDCTVSIDAAISYIDAYTITACFYCRLYLIVNITITIGIICYREDQSAQPSHERRSHRSSRHITVLIIRYAGIDGHSGSGHIHPATMV